MDSFAWLTAKKTENRGGLKLYSIELLNEEQLRDKVSEVEQDSTRTLNRSYEEIIERLNRPVNGDYMGQEADDIQRKSLVRVRIECARAHQYAINVMQHANLSTLLHETNHAFLLEMDQLINEDTEEARWQIA